MTDRQFIKLCDHIDRGCDIYKMAKIHKAFENREDMKEGFYQRLESNTLTDADKSYIRKLAKAYNVQRKEKKQ